jgi:hypothetical protein
LVESCRKKSRRGRGTPSSQGNAGNRQNSDLSDDQAHHVARLPAERHAHANLVRALADHEGEHAEDSCGCDRRSEEAEER